MNITTLEIENFLTVGSAKIELDNRGLLLIQGINGDDPSAESNGAGKSSIVDSLCWAIYGTTARGVSGDSVVNKTAKKNCCVTVTLQDAGKEYRIVRYRKHATGKNMVTVSERDLATGAGSDLSKGTDKETQEVINKVMGCSLDVFMSSVYAGQERMPDLPGMTDKMLKTLIEEAAGVEVLSAAYAQARNRLNEAKAALDVTSSSAAVAKATQTRLLAESNDMLDKSIAFDAERTDRAKAELAKIPPITREIAKLTEELAALDPAAIKAESEDAQAKIAAYRKQQDEARRLDQEAVKATRAADAFKVEVAGVKRSLEAAKLALANIEEQIGKACGECGKTYCEHDLDEARAARAQAIAELDKSLREKVPTLKAVLDKAKQANDEATAYRLAMTDVTAVAARQRELSDILSGIDATGRDIETKHKDIEFIKKTAGAKLRELNPWTKAIESKTQEIARNDEQLMALEKRVEELQAKYELLADAAKVFGPAGVRAHVLDTVTPFLNERTQDYLGALADGNIHAVWATLSKTAKGDLKEKFNIEVTNDKGAESFAGLSGGEKRKVRLATAMALQDMVASRATKPINIFIADEVDHALDESGLERLMGVLERKARERGTVLVISHNSLSDWIDNVITVTKSSGMATVSGATERGF